MKRVREATRRLMALGITVMLIAGSIPQTAYAAGTSDYQGAVVLSGTMSESGEESSKDVEVVDNSGEGSSVDAPSGEEVKEPSEEISEDTEEPGQEESEETEQDQAPEEVQNPEDIENSDSEASSEVSVEDADNALAKKEPAAVEDEALSGRAVIDPNATKTIVGLGTGVMSNPVAPQSEKDPWAGSFVYYGNFWDAPLRYRVLSREKMLLDCDTTINEYSYHLTSKINMGWRDSDIRKWFNGDKFLNKEGVFTTIEKDSLVTMQEDHSWDGFAGDEKVFALSKADVLNPDYGYSKGWGECKARVKEGRSDSGYYWDRDWWLIDHCGSPAAFYVSYYGPIESEKKDRNLGYSPAFIIDPLSVVLTSQICTESSPKAGAVGAEYNLALMDEDIFVYVTDTPTYYGGIVTIPCSLYDYSNRSEPSCIMAIATNGTWTENGWSKGAKILQSVRTDAEEVKQKGYISFELDESVKGDYHIYLVAMEENAPYETDYAGIPTEVTGIDNEHGTVEVTATLKEGSNSIDLSKHIGEGGKASIDSTKIEDADGVLSGTPTITGKTLNLTIKEGAESGKNVMIPVLVKGVKGMTAYTIKVFVTVWGKSEHDDVRNTIDLHRGSNTINLSSYIEKGGKVSLDSEEIEDVDLIISGTPSVSGKKLLVNIKDDVAYGKMAKIIVTVKDADEYRDYKIVISGTVKYNAVKTVASLGTSAITNPVVPQSADSPWKGSYVYFGNYGGPLRHRVLSKNTDKYNEDGSSEKRTLLLDCDQLLYASPFNNGESSSNASWENSDIKPSLSELLYAWRNTNNIYSYCECWAIAHSYASSRPLTGSDAGRYGQSTALTGEQLFFLDVGEATNPEYGYYQSFRGVNDRTRQKATSDGSSEHYWLRTTLPSDSNYAAAAGGASGDDFHKVNMTKMGASESSDIYISPALNINLGYVVYTSVIDSSESSQGIGETGAEYTLGIRDNQMELLLKDGPEVDSAGRVTGSFYIRNSSGAWAEGVAAIVTDGTWTGNGWSEGAQLLQFTKLDFEDFDDYKTITGSFRLDDSITDDCNIYFIAFDEMGLFESDYVSAPVFGCNYSRNIAANGIDYTGEYDGKAHGITVEVTYPETGATVKYGTEEGTYNLTESPVITNVSDSPMTVYYQASAAGYPPKTGSATVTINKADPEVTLPTARTELEYDGTDQFLVNAGYTEEGILLYALTDKDAGQPEASAFTEDIPHAINAGNYDVWYMVKGDENHKDTVPQKIEVEIEPETYGGKGTYDLYVPAGQATQNVTFEFPEIKDVEGYVVLFTNGTLVSGNPSASGRILTFSTASKPAGTYSEIVLIAKMSEDKASNYVVGTVSVRVTATGKSEAGVSITGGDRQVDYGVSKVELSGAVENAGIGTGVWTWNSSNSSVAEINSKTGEVTVKQAGFTFITATYSSESTIGSEEICLTVRKKLLDITWDDTSLVFNGTAQKPTATLTGILEGDECSASISGEQTNVGVGYIAKVFLDGANAKSYVIPGDKETCAFSIGKADIRDAVITLAGTLKYNGFEQSQNVKAEIGGMDVTSHFDVTDNRATIPGKYTLTVTAREDGYFTGSETKDFTLAVNTDEPEIRISSGGIYAGSYYYFSFTGGEINPGFSVYNRDTGRKLLKGTDYQYKVVDNINAGRGKIIIWPVENGYYDFEETSMEFEIRRSTYWGDYEIEIPTRTYPKGMTVTDTIDLADYVPSELGQLSDIIHQFGRGPHTCDKVEGSKVTFTVYGDEGGYITLSAVSQNYNSRQDSIFDFLDKTFLFTLYINRQPIALYEKDKKTETARASRSLIVGKSFTLNAQIYDDDIVNKKVVWTSSNPDVATVTQDGKVTGMSAGAALITAVSEFDSMLYTGCTVNVTEAVTAVTLDKKSYSFGTGESTTLTKTILPLTAMKDLKWSTSNKDVVIVCDDAGNELGGTEKVSGKITGKTYDVSGLQTVKIIAKGPGSAKVTAEAVDGSGKKAVCSFTVGNPVPEFTVAGKGGASVLAAGKTLAMQVDWGGKAQAPKNTAVTWSVVKEDGETDGSDIATVSSKGVLTGKTEGVVKVVATSAASGISKMSDPITVYVPVKSAALNMTSGTVSVKGKDNANGLQLSVNVTSTIAGADATGTALGTAPAVEWQVDPKYDKYLNVSDSGLITANITAPVNNIPVTATVKAYNNYSKTLTCKVSIKEENPLKGIKISKSTLSIGEGNTADLAAALNPINPDGDKGYVWSSSDASIASVDETGKVTARKPGTATITVTANGKAVNKGKETNPAASCKVTVTPAVKAIDFTNAAALTDKGLKKGKTYTLKTKFILSRSKGKAATTGLVWTSSDESIATVSQKGAVKAIAPGRVTITATSSDNRVKGELPSVSVSFKVYNQVTKIAIDKKKLTLGTQSGSEYGMISVSALKPDDVTNPSITWTISNANVALAAISPNERVKDGSGSHFRNAGESITTREGERLGIKGLVPGTVKLTGVTTDGTKKKVTCSITIRGQVTGFSLKPLTNKTKIGQVEFTSAGKYRSRLKKGGKLALTPVVDINGVSGSATDKASKKTYAAYKKYTDVSISYRSSDINIATVDKKGKVTINKNAAPGSKATIYITTADGARTIQLKITVAE